MVHLETYQNTRTEHKHQLAQLDDDDDDDICFVRFIRMDIWSIPVDDFTRLLAA